MFITLSENRLSFQLFPLFLYHNKTKRHKRTEIHIYKDVYFQNKYTYIIQYKATKRQLTLLATLKK